MVKPLEIPWMTDEVWEGKKFTKSSVLLLMQQLAPVSIQMGLSLEKRSICIVDELDDFQA